jgi:PAS domain S-box-containing protein
MTTEAVANRDHDLIEAALAVNAAPTLDEAFAVLAEAGLGLVEATWLSVVVWDAALAHGKIHAAAGLASPFVGLAVESAHELRAAIESGVSWAGPPEPPPAGMDAKAAEILGSTKFILRVPLSTESYRATFHAAWERELDAAEVDNASSTLATLTRLTTLAERTRHSRERARLATVLEGVADGVILTTDEGVSTNSAARNILAIPEGFELRTSLLDPRTMDGEPFTLSPSQRPGEAMLAQHTGGGRFRIRCTALDGRELIVDGSVAPIEGGAVIAFRDVTEEHRREYLNEQYIRALFDAIPSAIVVRDPATHEVLAVNKAFTRMVGLPLDEIVGVISPAPWSADGNDDPALVPGTVFERLFRTPEGKTFPVEVAAHVVPGDDGEPALFFAICTNMSERRRLEQQLVQSGKLAAIGELAAGVAHEINNPLLAVLGLTEFLLMEAEQGSKAHERLKLIQQTGLEIKEIVRALLDFARESADELQIVSARDVVHSTLDLVRRTNAHKGIEFAENYETENAILMGNANQLKQLVLNLIANAREAMPNGGVVGVDVKRDGDDVLIVVTDEGAGVPPELVGRIFEPFFTTRRGRGGSGLGLPVSLGIAETHGGTLTVVTEPGSGCAFTVRLPAVQPEHVE